MQMLDTVPRVDYDRLWREQMEGFDHGDGAAEYWDRRSRTFHARCQNSDYAAELISRMELRPGYCVLDVGSGCGAVAIPLAHGVDRVTALDISPIRLEKLRRKAAMAGLNNIDTINQDWDRVTVGEEIAEHDIVLMSRCVPARLSDALQKINRAARSTCYVTWRAEPSDDLETELARAMDRKSPVYPDYALIYGELWRLNIPPRIEIFESDSVEYYPGLADAARGMARGETVNDRQFARLLAIAGKYTVKAGESYSLTRKTKWVLISWKVQPG